MLMLSDFVADFEKLPEPLQDVDDMQPWELLNRLGPILDGLPPEISGNAEIAPTAVLEGDISIGSGTRIGHHVVIEGPVFIGCDVEIAPGAHIRPYTLIGDGCHVGHGSEIKASVLCAGSKVASLAFAGDSILGSKARLGSGTITANRGFSQGEIPARGPDGKRHSTGRDFLGCVIGDSTRLGANCTVQPGTMISPYCWVYPATAVWGFVPAGMKVTNPHPVVCEENGYHELT